MTAAPDLATIDGAWPHDPGFLDELCPVPACDSAPPEPASGVRARPAPARPPLPLREVARRLVVADEAATRLRAELAERMSPGDRIEVDGAVVEFVAARLNGVGEVVARSGVRVRRRDRG